MNCELTKEDYEEIYHALGLAQARTVQVCIGERGERLAKGLLTLNRDDAQTIFHALEDKREGVRKGAYDAHLGECSEPCSKTLHVAQHITSILANIGHLGENLTARSPDSHRSENPNDAIEELRASLLNSSTGRENDFSRAETQKPDSQNWRRRFSAFISVCLRLSAAESAE